MKKKHRSDSFSDVNNHVNDGGVYFLLSLFITIRYPSLESANSLESQVTNIIGHEVAVCTRIQKNIATVLGSFSPATVNTAGTKAAAMLVSEQNLTQLLPFRSEGILSAAGIPIGTNIINNTVFFLDLFSKPEGASTIIAAKAGKGKSTLGYTFTLQLVCANTTVIYIDLKGTEVTECLSNAIDNLITIDFSAKSAAFINTMHLNKNIKEYGIAEATKVTAEMLAIFVNINEHTEGSYTDVISILQHAVRSYYNTMGVKEGVTDTFHLSEQMTFIDLIKYIGVQKDADGGGRLKNVFEIISRRLTDAIVTYDMRNNEHALDLSRLFGYEVIVFAFNKNEDVAITLIDQVRTYMVLMATKRIAKYNRANELFTVVMAEEGQRYLQIPALCRGISDLASGSRSDNLSVTMIMNDLNILADSSLSSFRSNVANFIIGSCDEEAVKILRNTFMKQQLADDVERIIRNPKKYERVFAVHFEIGSTEINSLVRCDLPKEVADMFKTRTIVME
jgi:hypothetical protein